MLLHYLINIATPPVLPNLQTTPNSGYATLEDLECEGCNIYFSTGTNWKSMNMQNVGELLKGFFNYFAFEYHWKNDVISIRTNGGLITKESKGWTTLAEQTGSQSQTIKSRYLVAIEDPFEISHNVARTVNKQGGWEIRAEFQRVSKMLKSVNGRKNWIRDVCVERIVPPRIVHQKTENNEEVTVVPGADVLIGKTELKTESVNVDV
jgi:terminal uridylyltransferase